MNRTIRLFSLLLALALLLPCLPASAAYSGSCGDNLTWSFDEGSGVLTVSGSGDMTDWQYTNQIPWMEHLFNIRSVSLPEGLTSIGANAFAFTTALEEITIPKSVKTIGARAFDNASGLTRVTIPKNVTAIGSYAFSSCMNLQSLTVDPENPAYRVLDGVLYTKDLTELILCPTGKTGEYRVPDGVTAIGPGAFLNGGLYSVTLPASLTTIGDHAFESGSRLTSLVIPEGVTSIGKSAFQNCSFLETVIIPASVVSIGEDAFRNFVGLTVYAAPGSAAAEYAEQNGIPWKALPPSGRCGENLTWLFNEETGALIFSGTGATDRWGPETPRPWQDCEIKSLSLPYGVTAIGDYAFAACASLSGVTFPDTVADIADGAFAGCTGLQSVTILNRSCAIADGAFDAGAALLRGYAGSTAERYAEQFGFSFEALPEPPEILLPFADVPEEDYYYRPVMWAVGHTPQITNGVSESYFSPNSTCTRAQVVTFLWRAAGCPEPVSNRNPFTDAAADQYYSKAVLWAVERGITRGTGPSTFSPDAGCTRGQVVTFLHRFENTPAPGSSFNPFTDVAADDYYYDAVLWAVNHEPQITNGTSQFRFSPDATCTRAQIVAFLYRDLA